MSDSESLWPLPNKPDTNARLILASRGVRMWTAECRLESFGEVMEVSCSDLTTLENIHRQQRVAFTIIDTTGTLQGSGMAQLPADSNSLPVRIIIAPYRISSHGENYELRLKGWTRVMDTAPPDVSRFSFWYQAFRLVTLPLSALPVLVGQAAAFAQGQFNLLFLILSLIGTISAHAGANAAADYFDFKNGVDSSRALSSHLGALARERVEPELILLAAFVCFMVTAFTALILVQIVGWQLLIFAVIGLLGAYFYTGHPISYKYRGLGELMLGLLMGPLVVMGAYYVQTQGWNWGVFLISLALGMLISSISLANNLRDMPDDKLAGIRTLPMRLGISRTKKLYYFLTGGSYLVSFTSIAVEPAFWPLLLALISLPQAVRTIRDLSSTEDDIAEIREKSLSKPYPLNSIRLHARFGLFLVVGLVVSGVIRIVY